MARRIMAIAKIIVSPITVIIAALTIVRDIIRMEILITILTLPRMMLTRINKHTNGKVIVIKEAIIVMVIKTMTKF